MIPWTNSIIVICILILKKTLWTNEIATYDTTSLGNK